MTPIKKILWLAWKDSQNPYAGGAERVREALAKSLTAQGYEVLFLVAGFANCKKEEAISGFRVIRLGNRLTVFGQAFLYYQKHLRRWPDLVIEEINTIPFFSKFYVKEKSILFFHQLCREIWFYEQSFPINLLGWSLEPLYLRLLSNQRVITISQSTKSDLLRYGFKKEKIFEVSEGLDFTPLKDLPPLPEIKNQNPTILFLGAFRRMKRVEEVIAAFAIAKKQISSLKLWLIGDIFNHSYYQKIKKEISDIPFSSDVTNFGKVSEDEKITLLKKVHLLCVTSVKEGWGLVVTEANALGTPAIVYNVDGLRDSVKNQVTGIVCQENTPQDLAKNIVELLLNQEKYQRLRKSAWQKSKEISFEKSLKQLEKIFEIL